MDASLQSVLNDSERLLVGETEPAALAALDEDAAIEVESRIRRARNKYAAMALRAERLEAVRAAKQRDHPGAGQPVPRPRRPGPAVRAEPTGDRALRSPASEKARAGTLASGARRQAKRDNRGSSAR